MKKLEFQVTFLLFLSFGLIWGLKDNAETKCDDYQNCHPVKQDMINVHLIPHTHDDVGWIVTVDQYYYRQVQWILDGVVKELAADPDKRFIYVEIAFFERWFEEQNNSTQELVKRLVNEGRLEFILGGWCMNDEASTHYQAIIDQHKLGFEYLRNKFGKCGRTKIGWQIDPFGHSREQASIFAQFGFDGLFFGRLDYQDKESRELSKTMEMVWKGSPNNLGEAADLFTGVLPNGYGTPDGFSFTVKKILASVLPDMFRDDPKLRDYNVPQMVDNFIQWVHQWHSWYGTNHLVMTMGGDFNYVSADMWFKNLDKIIKYVNARKIFGSQINVLYSTPSCYLKALNDANQTWTTKEDDFFPYANTAHTFWTGYFTSRPAIKYYARETSNFFQSVKQMAALTKLNNKKSSGDKLNRLAEVLGVAQHHDAISGTEKQAVTFDYAQRLAEGVEAGKSVLSDAYDVILPIIPSTTPIKQEFCLLLNESLCSVSEFQSNFQVTLYNPISRPVEYYTHLPVQGDHYSVIDVDGVTPLPVDIVPQTPDTSRIPTNSSRLSHNELIFKASLPAMGLSTYFVQKSNSLTFTPHQPQARLGTVLKGKYVSLEFDAQGHVKSMTNLKAGITIPLTQNYYYYKGAAGDNKVPNMQASGAYIFRPSDNTPENLTLSLCSKVIGGQLVQEVYQEFSSWVSQVWRVYEDKPFVEVQWTVGPIPIDDHVGKEVVTRYNVPGWNTSKTFYTDSNGREVLERILNYRPTWKLEQTEPVAGNYFPVNAFAYVKDQKSDVQLTVLVDRSQGGASLHDGDLELMLHRRLLYDDGKGVGEALNERGMDGKGLVVRGSHYLFVEKSSLSARLYRPFAKEVYLKPQITFSTSDASPSAYMDKYNTVYTGLAVPLPSNVHVLTLERFRESGPIPSPSGSIPYLLRLEHFYEKGEDKEFSVPAKVDIQGLFIGFKIAAVHELSLGANIPIEEVKRLQWKTKGSGSGSNQPVRHLTNTTVTLNPMEIVTLQVDLLL